LTQNKPIKKERSIYEIIQTNASAHARVKVKTTCYYTTYRENTEIWRLPPTPSTYAEKRY